MGKFNGWRREVKAVLETVLGTTPASALKKIKAISGGMDSNILTVPDGQINTDGMDSDIIQLSDDAGGSLGFNLRYGELDDIFKSALRSAWATAVNISATDIAAQATGNWFSSTTTNCVLNNMTIGQIVLSAGFTAAANNGLAEITALAARKITVAGLTLTTEVAGDTVTIKGKCLKNGNSVYGLTIEEEFLDITRFHQFTGSVIDKLSINLKSQAKAEVTATFRSFKGTEAGATCGTGAEVSAATTIPMNCNAQLTAYRLNGAALAVGIEEMTIDIDNKLIPDVPMTSANPTGFALSPISVSGKCRIYFEGSTEYAYYRNQTALKLAAILKDASNQYIAITVSRAKVNGCKIVAGNTARGMIEFTFTGTKNTTTNCAVQMDTFAA